MLKKALNSDIRKYFLKTYFIFMIVFEKYIIIYMNHLLILYLFLYY